jgi:hypothetical protein
MAGAKYEAIIGWVCFDGAKSSQYHPDADDNTY